MAAGDSEYGSLLDLALSVTDAVGPLLSDAAQPSLTSGQGMQLLAAASQLLTVRKATLRCYGLITLAVDRWSLCCVTRLSTLDMRHTQQTAADKVCYAGGKGRNADQCQYSRAPASETGQWSS